MKAYLSFNLPEDSEEFKDAQNGSRLKIAVEEFDDWLRGLEKYSNLDTVSIQEARDKLREFKDSRLMD